MADQEIGKVLQSIANDMRHFKEGAISLCSESMVNRGAKVGKKKKK